MNEMYSSRIETPAGALTVLADREGTVHAAGFGTDSGTLLGLVHPRLRRDVRERPELGPVTSAVRSYLDGDLTAIDAVPVAQHTDGAFLAHAWETLRQVKPGEPVTYTEFAELSGRPRAVRAAAMACARNAAALFVPCHRVLRTDGGLGGFRWGLPVKRWLLAHEGSPVNG
ncbi:MULTISPECIES: methylated-DNA--[protein]-cysteine S-methyltransferase [unclassified Plantactinospora]|uniref:methylated-DNA--[protein]-cysteine S-methyltransferase n=1 Tax=unclassified Plantactinospora TaxID=2631981 RepID=UPI000D1535EF|nr:MULTISPECIES: methylated-DNA--[protein]-cysteine S-methyltransferase [unclassified Plantactinospora]AVT33859.1 methylated-DNA--protein-cysteine methyltransferase [Plantactinospora sp. BC1]AVT36770.1 methylated-DNA--protein-cysteine methyltransferase [Plantactinospora sp. BB1]